jgi:YD repeat-containing protein
MAYPSPNGGTEAYKFCFAQITVDLSYNATTETWATSTPQFLQSVLLPNNQSWIFAYESPSGNLAQITLPTGGTIAYSWTDAVANPCAQMPVYNESVYKRTVNANDGSGAHTWTYSQATSGGFNWSAKVTDPNNNDTVTQFATPSTSNCSWYPQVVTYYNGAASGGSVLKTVTTGYQSSTGFDGNVTDILPSSLTTTLENGQTTQTTMTYDSGFTYSNPDPLTTPTSFTTPYGKVLTQSVYDYGSGAAGALLQQKVNTWQALQNSTYLANNLLNLPASESVYDGGGNLKEQTVYGYDETALAASGITTQHNASPPDGTARGNLTSVRKWLSGSTPLTTSTCSSPNIQSGYLVSKTSYFDTGEVNQSTDPCGHSTTYAYSSTYVGAYPTTVTNALSQSQTYTYDFNTGLKTGATDPNGQTTTYAYTDPLSRLTDVYYPAAPDVYHVNYAYDDSVSSPGVTVTESATAWAAPIKSGIRHGAIRSLRPAPVPGRRPGASRRISTTPLAGRQRWFRPTAPRLPTMCRQRTLETRSPSPISREWPTRQRRTR